MAEAGLTRQGWTGFRQGNWLGYRHLFICALFSFAAGLVVASFAGFKEFLPGLLEGAWVTIQITVAACVLAVVCGLLAGLAKMSPFRPVRWLAIGYIELFRGTSALVQLFWLYYVLPNFGITLDAIPVAILALGLNVGAYGAEVVRGAVMAVPRGQYEAAIALNMSPFTRMRRIILPQALVAMIPPWGNLFIELLKATAIVSLITVSDLTFKAYQLNQATLRTVTIFLLVLVMYLGIALVITFFMRGVERYTRKSLGAG
jgi:polar amino acid transport system permease protein